MQGKVDPVRMLLRRRASVAVTEQHGHTALHVASSQGHTTVVTALLEGRADVHAVNHAGDNT